MTTAVPLEEYCVNLGTKYEDTKLEKLVVRHLLATFILPMIQFTHTQKKHKEVVQNKREYIAPIGA